MLSGVGNAGDLHQSTGEFSKAGNALSASSQVHEVLVLQVLVARQLIHMGDQKRVLVEDRREQCRVHHLTGKDVEVETELEEELVLPLIDKTTRCDDKAALDVVPK